MFSDQYLLQIHISRHADLYQVVTETGCIFSDIAMETIAYATVTKAKQAKYLAMS